MERRFVAILFADVDGYERLMEADEAGTITRLNSHQQLIDSSVARHGGRTIYLQAEKVSGECLLSLFPSSVSAVLCAVEVQRAMAESEVGKSEEGQIQYRIGVHFGEIVLDGDGVMGADVSIAARITSVARPGGVCISGNVYEIVQTHLDLTFADIGIFKLRAMAPLHLWHWPSDSLNTAAAVP